MSDSATSERLYGLLPALYRVRDVPEGQPLRTLLRIIESELNRVGGDIAGLYDNWFIETCDEWVVPYIGDLLGVRPIRAVQSASVSTRAYVANTLAYRRRKGTAVVLEQLARDTTGWPARAVEFFARLATTQHMNHTRSAPSGTTGIRSAVSAELADSPFDPFGHTADVRRIASGRGRHNIPNLGLFLWRLVSYSVGRGNPGDEDADFGSARMIDGPEGTYWTFHPVGVDAPLFSHPETETTITHLAEEHNVPGLLRHVRLHEELERARHGEADTLRFMSQTSPMLRVLVELQAGTPWVEITPEDLYVCEIPDDVEFASPPHLAVAIDPARGRLSFPSSVTPHRVAVTFNYGFSGDLGGGTYDRTQSVIDAGASTQVNGAPIDRRTGFFDPDWQVGVSQLLSGTGPDGPLLGTLRQAVSQWNLQPAGTTGVIVVMDGVSEHDVDSSPSGPLELEIPENSRLLIVAGFWPLEKTADLPSPVWERLRGRFVPDGVRPHFVGELRITGTAPPSSTNPGACLINGLLVEGAVHVADGNLGLLHLAHSTIVPAMGGIVVEGGNHRLELALQKMICGPVVADPAITRTNITDSIIDGAGVSPNGSLSAAQSEAIIERSTMFGTVSVQSLSASECIFADHVEATRRQTGCVRFSYVPPGSAVPRRFRCQPDLAVSQRLEEAREQATQDAIPLTSQEERAIAESVRATVKPSFVSMRYGDPTYGQLELRCPQEIRTGSENGVEMGAFAFLQQAHREANLRAVLSEYVPFGLETGVFFVT